MRRFATIVLILIGLAVLWLRVSFPTVSYRYRLTIAVESDGQPHSGSSVIQVNYAFWPKMFSELVGGNPGQGTVAGQAVLVDLGIRGALVAALAGLPTDNCSVKALYVLGRAYDPSRRRCISGYPLSLDNEKALAQKRGSVELTSDNLPAFIWFADKADATTMRKVEPNEFAAVIGDSTRLLSARVEITLDPVVIDLDKRLPALASLRDPSDNGLCDAKCKSFISPYQFISRAP